MGSGHLDRRTVKRKGWFLKKEKKQPIKSYRKTCVSGGRGFTGPRHEAHHILPQTSIEESVSESGKDLRYIADVQYITDWNINHQDNMIGLPHFHAYMLFYQGKSTLTQEAQATQEGLMVTWFNKYKKKSRNRWLNLLQTVSPEKHPIHNPVNWGHTKYNEEVIQEIKDNVWNQVNDQQKKHQLDAATVEAELNTWAQINHDYLIARGAGTTKKLWDRRKKASDNGWFEPFTMADVSNPLFG